MKVELFYTNIFQKQDRIRAFDFCGKTNCYVEGRIINDYHMKDGVLYFVVMVDKRVFEGKEETFSEPTVIYVPHETETDQVIKDFSRIVEAA